MHRLVVRTLAAYTPDGAAEPRAHRPERSDPMRSHGWRVVAFCFLAAVFTWGLGVFGASVYLSEVTKARGWSVTLVSASITAFYLTAAFVLPAVGAAVDRLGARPVIAVGALLLGVAVAAVGQVTTPSQ